jgi:hypothetical protein
MDEVAKTKKSSRKFGEKKERIRRRREREREIQSERELRKTLRTTN